MVAPCESERALKIGAEVHVTSLRDRPAMPPSNLQGSELDFTRYIGDRTAGFAGREWALARLASWWNDVAGAPVLAITGPPGSGKTALAARLVAISRGDVTAPHLPRTFLAAYHFCSSRERLWTSANAFAASMGIQLARYDQDYAAAVLTTVPGRTEEVYGTAHAEVNDGTIVGVYIAQLFLHATSATEAFRMAVREPLAAVCRDHPERRFLLLVDALDEALTAPEGKELVELVLRAEEMPRQVRLLVTCRPELGLLRDLRQLRGTPDVLSLGSDGPRELLDADVATYVDEWLRSNPQVTDRFPADLSAQEFARTVVERSDGNFLYVRYLLAGLAAEQGQGDERAPGRINRSTLKAFPSDLDAVYLHFLDRVTPAGARESTRRLLGALAVVREPVPEAALADYAGLDRERAREACVRLHQFLDPSGGREHIALYHRSLADLVLDERRAEEFWCPAPAAHARVAERCKRALSSDDSDAWDEPIREYALRHVGVHLLSANASVAGADALLAQFTPAFLQLREQRLGTHAATLDDLRLAIGVARDDVPMLARWSWASAILRERMAHRCAPPLVPLLVRAGRVAEALDTLRTLEPDLRAGKGSLSATFEYTVHALVEAGRPTEARAVARRAPDTHLSASLLRSVAVALAVRDPNAALSLWNEIENETEPNVSATHRAAIAGALGTHREFVDAARALASDDGRAVQELALAVVEWDPERALALAASAPPYEERAAGSLWRRTADTVRAHLVERIAIHDAVWGERVALTAITDAHERESALVSIVAAVARQSSQRALALIDRVTGARATRAGCAPPAALTEGRPAWALALALSGAAAASDPAFERQVEAHWDRRDSSWFVARKRLPRRDANTLDLLARAPLTALRGSPIARRIVMDLVELYRPVLGVDEDEGGFRYPGDGAKPLIRAAATVAPALALDLVSACGRAHDQALVAFVGACADTEPDIAWAAHSRAQLAWTAHEAYLAGVRAAARGGWHAALRFAERMDRRYGLSLAEGLGIVGTVLPAHDADAAAAVLARHASFADSESFTIPYHEVGAVLAGHLAARTLSDDPTGSDARYARWGPGSDGPAAGIYDDRVKATHALVAAASGDVARTIALLPAGGTKDLSPSLGRAALVIRAATIAPSTTPYHAWLTRAAEGLLASSSGRAERKDLLARAAPLLAPTALDTACRCALAAWDHWRPIDVQHPIGAVVEAARAAGIAGGTIAAEFARAADTPDLRANERNELCAYLLGTAAADTADVEASLSRYASNDLERYRTARSAEPLLLLDAWTRDAHRRRDLVGLVAGQPLAHAAALASPEIALQHYMALEPSLALRDDMEEDVEFEPDMALEPDVVSHLTLQDVSETLVFTPVRQIAKRSAVRALALMLQWASDRQTAPDDARSSLRLQAMATDVLKTIAATVAPTMPRLGLDALRRIEHSSGREHALKLVLHAVPTALLDSDPALRTDLLAEVSRLEEAPDRQSLYDALISRAEHARPVPGLCADVLRAMADADRGTYLHLLPRVLDLACHADRSLAERFAPTPEWVREVAAS